MIGTPNKWTVMMRTGATIALLQLVASLCLAQPRIAAVRPDAAAPGMNVVLEVLAPAIQFGAFGPDGLTPAGTRLVLDDPRDSNRIMVGPLQVSWNGRLLQAPLFILPQAFIGTVAFHIVSPQGSTPSEAFYIQIPQHLGLLGGAISLGDGTPGVVTPGNTLVVDSLTVAGGLATLSLASSDSNASNPRLQPLTILSKGPIRLIASQLSVSADGVNGGPGGGGGGHGHSGVGGFGFTGGGNSSAFPANNTGSGSAATDTTGGASLTGIFGGQSEKSDQGGGGGTGHPFGTSGRAGAGGDTSRAGGYGGGSAGGELAPQIRAYGGGGGGFGTAGGNGVGTGANGGHVTGGRFLVPLAGGSGGGAGNALNEAPDAGSGGGGGGAISVVTYDSLFATDATVSASGDSGTAGGPLTAGGGGGSGGAVYLATAKGALGQNFGVNVRGGAGGIGGLQGGQGGIGGDGRIRFDGAVENCPQCVLLNVVRGLSIFPDSTQHKGDSVQVRGVPSDPQNTSDTVRIFYRTRHSGWMFVDTIRYTTAGPVRWSKWLPAFHDSLLFVAAFAKVLEPNRSSFNCEPSWLPSHVSLSVVRHKPSPFLVVADSVWLGSIRRGHCSDTWIRIQNLGEQPLRIDSATIIGSSRIRVLSTLPRTLPAYTTDSLLVHFCPDSAAQYHARLTLFSNDTARVIAMGGQGLERSDSLILIPKLVDLGRVKRGTCDSIDVRGFSKGSDTVYLTGRVFTQGSYTLRLLTTDTAIAAGDTARLRLYYCFNDTGGAVARFRLSERGDTLRASAFVYLRLFALHTGADTLHLCGSSLGRFVDTVASIGNDTATLIAVQAANGSLNVITPVPASLTSTLSIESQTIAGASTLTLDTLEYVFSDTTLRHPVVIQRTLFDFVEDSALNFGAECVSACDTSWIRIRNNGLQPAQYSITGSSFFSVLKTSVTIPGQKVDSIGVVFCPSLEQGYSDTLYLTATIAECDSIVAITLRGVGTTSQIALDTVMFDSVLIGQCATDSLTISNPCGPDVTITNADVVLPFSIDLAQLPLTVPSRSHKTIGVKFCPDSIGRIVRQVILTTATGDVFRSSLSGIGYDTTQHPVTLTISLGSLAVIAGQTGAMPVRIESTNIAGRHELIGHIHFDHRVLYPEAPTAPFTITRIAPDSLLLRGNVEFSNNSDLGSLNWLGLLGPASTADVTATWDVDTLNAIAGSRATVMVLDCSGLSGRISSAASFVLGQSYPNPSSNSVTFPVESDASGVLSVSVYDRLGRLEYAKELVITKGQGGITLETGRLPNGLHSIVFSGTGWRLARVIAVAR